MFSPGPWCSRVVLLVLATAFFVTPATTKTQEEWQKLSNTSFDKCLAGVKMSKVEVMKALNTSKELPSELRCFSNCLDKNNFGDLNGKELMNTITEFVKDYYKDDPEKLKKAMQIHEMCRDIKGKDDCDTATKRMLCHKESVIKVNF
ncbi:hypothetical protein B566_EDAN016527 [Ephemera danica]|nr:hypothetical protein B566_EDAN016527 [Ephemera danica]